MGGVKPNQTEEKEWAHGPGSVHQSKRRVQDQIYDPTWTNGQHQMENWFYIYKEKETLC